MASCWGAQPSSAADCYLDYMILTKSHLGFARFVPHLCLRISLRRLRNCFFGKYGAPRGALMVEG